MANTAEVVEIMSTIQGEGPYVGHRQVFVRFAGCNLDCFYCDTKFTANQFCIIEKTPGKRDYQKITNPVSVVKLMDLLRTYDLNIHQGLSITGGEPLLQQDFLMEFLSGAGKLPCRILLETNGTLYHALQQLIDYIDIVSMDIKLPSSTGTNCWEAHKNFLEVASRKECYVKVVVTARTEQNELSQTARLIKEIDPRVPLIIQPVAATNVENIDAPDPEQLLRLQETALRELTDVRVIPQTHKYLGQL